VIAIVKQMCWQCRALNPEGHQGIIRATPHLTLINHRVCLQLYELAITERAGGNSEEVKMGEKESERHGKKIIQVRKGKYC